MFNVYTLYHFYVPIYILRNTNYISLGIKRMEKIKRNDEKRKCLVIIKTKRKDVVNQT